MRCYVHFIQDDSVTTELLHDYKLTLYLISSLSSTDEVVRILPVSIVDKIVDDYLDVRTECYICHYKFSSFDDCLSYGCAISCCECHNWVCEACSDRCGGGWDEISYYCLSCYEIIKALNTDSDNDLG